jgi:hypothetical protein
VFSQVPQDLKRENNFEQKIEQIAEDNEDTDIDYTIIFDELLFYIENPINLNCTNREELQSLHLLSDIQINSFLKHIEQNGKLIAIYELQSLKEFDLETIQRILPYVTVNSDLDRPRISFKEMMRNGRHELIARQSRVLEQQKGYSPIDDSTLSVRPNSRYLGSPDRLFFRYRFNYSNKISWGMTAEKDPGEEFFKGSQKQGFDFYTAHLFLRNMGVVKALAIGDFQAQFGQGMTLWSGLAFRKSSYILNLKRQGMGLRPTGSVEENRFMRGAGITLGYNNFELTTFGSLKKVDANTQIITDTINVDDEELIIEQTLITSLIQTGFHRTPLELERRKSIRESVFGGNIAYKKRNFSIGLTAVKTAYNGEFSRNLSFHNQFEFNSSENFNVGFDYNYIVRNLNFFGEVSQSASGGKALVNGIIMSVDPRMSLIFMHRDYQRHYQVIYGVGVGEGIRVANEQGIYAGVILNPLANVSINAYYDRFVFPWMRFRVNAPSHGSDFLAQVNYTPSKKTDMYFRIRQRDRFLNSATDDDDIVPIVPTKQTLYRFNFNHELTSKIRLRNRIDMIDFQFGENEIEKGYLMLQDLIYKPRKFPVSLTLRYALFDTESFNTRIYTYESDVLYAFSIPAFYMRGSRMYGMLRYTFKRNFDLWIRYGQTFYYNREVIGTGLEEINGNIRSELRLQVRYRF